MKALQILLLTTTVLLISCSKESLRGSGNNVAETRTVAAFTGVRLEGSGRANITSGTTQNVVVRGYENLVPVYQTVVNNGVLVLKFNNDDYLIHNSNIEVDITIPELSKAMINGSGEIHITNFNGSAIEAEINGSGDVYTTNNKYETCRLLINGSGYIRAKQLEANTATARITGSGKIDLSCAQKLDATIQGSGEINYWGQPTEVTSEVSGSGIIRRRS